MLLSTKSKGHKSNFRISWMYRSCFYDLKVHFWWPNKCSKHQVLRSNTLYKYFYDIPVHRPPQVFEGVLVSKHSAPICITGQNRHLSEKHKTKNRQKRHQKIVKNRFFLGFLCQSTMRPFVIKPQSQTKVRIWESLTLALYNTYSSQIFAAKTCHILCVNKEYLSHLELNFSCPKSRIL